jgi:hypothetical protein
MKKQFFAIDAGKMNSRKNVHNFPLYQEDFIMCYLLQQLLQNDIIVINDDSPIKTWLIKFL